MASKLTLDGGIALAASGVGKETVLAFAEAGARGVVLADVKIEGIEAAAEESRKCGKHANYRALAIKVDITDPESVQHLVASTVREFGRIDYAVNCAGVSFLNTRRGHWKGADHVFSEVIDTNMAGAVRFVRAAMAAMAQQEPLTFTGRHGLRSLGKGSIDVLGSTSSLAGIPGMISYTTSKHVVIGLVKSAAVDALALQSAIRVNAVCPCWVDTPMVQLGIEKNPMLKPVIDNLTPLKRAASVDEVADYIIFLSSPYTSFINGIALSIDAGLTLPTPPSLPLS
ncbi:hypothetical protein JX265_001827 [Neoarthrinium moseri]|uniref:Uncharacterized protein n=1 Tax=Neoarthrinium moseri TaxID=1658444 RepID=A0A9P9WVW0_9PEZI|nr:hypothetical protein JX266_010305 [Neoarthrinium moseri]KAI1880206.1 hypothetical protein JX265_001827 [Neoarthrinium moseri]